jgi:hypothetical protein
MSTNSVNIYEECVDGVTYYRRPSGELVHAMDWIRKNDAWAIRPHDENGNVLTEAESRKLTATSASPELPELSAKKGFTSLGNGHVRDSATGNVYKLRSDGNLDVWVNTPADVQISSLTPSDPSKMNTRKIYDHIMAGELVKKMPGKAKFDGKIDRIAI